MSIGGGSSTLKEKYEVSPFQALSRKIGEDVDLMFARGYVADNEARYNKESLGEFASEYRSGQELIEEACEMAVTADLVIFIGGLNKHRGQDCEGADRKSFELPYAQDSLIEALVEVNPNLVVVNISGNAVAMPWLEKVPAVVQSWYNGTEAGNALAAVLTGDVNPSGKLPFTFNEKLDDYGAHRLNTYPGNDYNVEYRESIYIGYRWNDKEKIKPLFAFGHGLSYTSFKYGNAKKNKDRLVATDSLTISLDVSNTGNRDGAEVVQLYIKDNESSLPRPEKELKGFEKVFLRAGETKKVCFVIDQSQLSFFDPKQHEFIVEPGKFEAWIGTASDNIKRKIDFELE